MFSSFNSVSDRLFLLHIMARPAYALPASSPLSPLSPPYAIPAPSPLSSPPPPLEKPKVSLEDIAYNSTVAADILALACFAVFSFLIGLDVCRAFKKRAIWLPGKAFALSGVTVQIIVWLTIISHFDPSYNRDIETLLDLHALVVSGRVAVCVFIGYLLPGMTAPSVRAYGALAVTICAQIASELFLLYNPTDTESGDSEVEYIYSTCLKKAYPGSHYVHIDKDCMQQQYLEEINATLQDHHIEITWSKTADLVLFISILVLGLILCCTILASKTIESLLKQRNLAIAKESKSQFSVEKMKSFSSISKENDFEDEVLKSWFVARVCQIDYVICRSVLSSAVWVIVTICVIVLCKSGWEAGYYSPVISPLPSFIMVGWVVICWRWLAAQLYCAPKTSWRRRWEIRWLCWEDFWTSHTIQLIDMYDFKRERQRFQNSNSKMTRSKKLQSLPARIFTKIRLHKLLYLVLVLQVCVVLFCKVCGFLSDATVGEFLYWCARFVFWFRECVMKKNLTISQANFTKCLECLCMPGEDVSTLWEANKMSLNKAKSLMKKGREEGSSSDQINSIFCTYSPQWAEEGAQLLKVLDEKSIPSVLSHFSSVEKHYVKMTVLSLITVFIELHKAKSDSLTKAMKACREVWDLISFVDECDIDLQADKINLLDDLNKGSDQVCMAANREFYKLQMMYENLPPEREDCFKEAESVRGFLEHLSKKCENVLKEENILQCHNKFPKDLRDSRSWAKITPSYGLYKLCKLMLDENNQYFVASYTNQNSVTRIEKYLRDIIACSMSKLPDMIVKQCWVWAQELEEDKLWEAIQLAGKCKGMMEEWVEKPKSKVNTKEHKTLYQRFKMCISCRSEEEAPSQPDQTSTKTEQCTIDVKESPEGLVGDF